MEASYHRHDISDKVWAVLGPHSSGQRGQWGGIAQDNRRFINAVFWVLRTGAPWRNLPPDYGKQGQRAPEIYSMAQEGNLGKPAGNTD